MTLEIERKFLVTSPLDVILKSSDVTNKLSIEQYYLPNTGNWTVRVRRTKKGSPSFGRTVQFFLTMKKKVTAVTCVEIEQPISRRTFETMKDQCSTGLQKTRYEISYKGHVWELDHFTQDPFTGLLVAEIELKGENDVFISPPWLGEEVTYDKQYKNVKMAKLLGVTS